MKTTALGIVLSMLLLPIAAVCQVSVTTGDYSQNFNGTFPGTATYNLTDNAAANLGWYSLRATANAVPNVFTADDGSLFGAQFYNYGPAGNPDRALGSVASAVGTGTTSLGLRLQNDTGLTVLSVRVQYTGEQWHAVSLAPEVLAFSYQVSAGDITSLTGAFTPVPVLSFTSPNVSITGPVDGNAAGNRVVFDRTIPVTVAQGGEIMLRWDNTADATAFNGLAIDDLTITLQPFAPTAEPISIEGRVVTSDGQGISRATVSLFGIGENISVVTNPFGYYRFTGLSPGNTYVISVVSKKYQFEQPNQVVSAFDNVANVDFIALPY